MVPLSTRCRNCGYSLITDFEPPEIRFGYYIGGNQKLDRSHADTVRETLSTTLSLTSNIDNEISRMENMLEILRRKREDMRKLL